MLKQNTPIELPGTDATQHCPDPQAAHSREILALYAAITDEDHWRSVLRRLCGHFGADGMGVLPGEGGAASAIATGIPAADLDAVCSWLAARAPPASAPQATVPAQDARHHWRLPVDAAVEGLSGSHLIVRLVHEGRTIGHADLYRAQAAVDFDAAAIDSFLALAPHLAQSLALALRLSAAETCSRRCAQCRDLPSFGCLVLDDAGSIMEMNRTASDWLGIDDGLRVTDGRLRALRASENQEIDRRLREVLGSEPLTGAVFLDVPRPSGRRPYVLFMSRIDLSPPAFGLRVPRVQLLIVDADRGHDVPREVLRALYRLTETESEMAWHLVNGASLEEAAQRLGIAHNTARHHLERIFGKTGAHRQSDLVRLALAPFVSIGGTR